jgi:hypothetical protein
MTFTTLTYNGVEKQLWDWGISSAVREVSNQSQDHVTCEVPMPADGADVWPYDAKIILQIGRIPQSGSGVSGAGVPLSGMTSWSGGSIAFVGYRGKPKRVGRGNEEKIQYPFLGCWERFFCRTIFQKLNSTYDGTANIADWLSEVVLGLSLTALTGAADTIPGTDATNLMSITQQIKEIVAWANARAAALEGSAPFQFINLAANATTGNYLLYTTPQDTLLLPDFVPGYGSGLADSNAANVSTSPFGPQNVSLRAPLDAVKQITCGEAIQKQARWLGPIGDIAIWFDNTTLSASAPLPTLNIASRDQLPSITLPFPPSVPSVPYVPLVGPKGPMSVAVSEIARLDELIPPAVDLQFIITGTWNGTPYKQIIHDICATIGGEVVEGIGLAGALYTAASFATGSPAYVGGAANSTLMQELESAAQLPDAIIQTIDMQGVNGNLDICTFATIPVNTATPAGGGTALAFWKYLFPELADVTSPDFFSGSTVSVVDDSGNPIDTSTFAYLLTGNTVASWMLAGNAPGGAGCQSVRAHITATFIGTENNDGVATRHIQHQPKHATPTLVTLPGGTYTRQNITSGDLIPFGLAGFIYNLSIIPHYEGTYTIQETEITDQCPFGNNLNLSGGRTEWTTMNAQIQGITYDYVAGTTAIRFGPAHHLGAQDLASRVQFNRGPRWFYLMTAGNITNAPVQQNGTQFGSDVAGKSPSHGPPAADLQVNPVSIADMLANASTYAPIGPPGATVDTRVVASGSPLQPNYGNVSGSAIATAVSAGLIGTPNAPTLFLAAGKSGTLTGQVRLTPADTVTSSNTSGLQVWLQEYPCFFNFNDGNGCVAAFVTLLGSAPYKTSIHGS